MNAVVTSPSESRLSRTESADVFPFEFVSFANRQACSRRSSIAAGVGDSMQGMRVTFVNRYFFPDMSATSQMLFDLTRRLAERGVAVSVVCSRQLCDDPNANLPAEETIEGVKVYRVDTTCFGRDALLGRVCDYVSFYATAVRTLLKITLPGDVLVAKTDPPLISVAVAAVARMRGALLINWLQDLFPEVATYLGVSLPRLLNGLLLRARDASLRRANINVVIGTRMRDRLVMRGVAASSIRLIENWADNHYVEPKPVTGSGTRLKLGLQHKFVVGYSGNLGRAHEYETILHTAIALRREQDIVFLMTGGGVKMQQLKQAVTERGLANVIFQPHQPRELLADSMAAADLHLTSLLPELEGLIVPSKFYGILAAGRPTIVIGDIDGELARIVKREQCGECVMVGDWDALVSAIWRMKQEPAYRHEVGVRARTVFLERHTADHGAERWFDLFAELQYRESTPQPAWVYS